MIDEIFKGADVNKFYTQLAEIANMAKSPYANFFIDTILNATAQWAHEHRDAIEKLQALAAAQNSQPQPDGALEPAIQEKQEPCSADKGEASDNAAAGCCGSGENCAPNV